MDTLNRNPEDRKVKGVIHWVSAEHALRLPVRMFDRLFTEEKPDADRDRDFLDFVNPQSMDQTIVYGEPSLAELSPGQTCQFERVGYFCADTEDSQTGEPTMNQTVGLRDTRAGKAGK
jgi:glutaminyl-tRNA synthetase